VLNLLITAYDSTGRPVQVVDLLCRPAGTSWRMPIRLFDPLLLPRGAVASQATGDERADRGD
jgi:hypothetical protein